MPILNRNRVTIEQFTQFFKSYNKLTNDLNTFFDLFKFTISNYNFSIFYKSTWLTFAYPLILNDYDTCYESLSVTYCTNDNCYVIPTADTVPNVFLLSYIDAWDKLSNELF